MIRRYLAELIGTFLIVFAPVALSASSSFPGGTSGLVGAALVSGLSVTVMVYTFGPISAAHFNPAVTLGFAVAGRFPWRYVASYWVAQFLGAVLAAGVVTAMFGPGYGTHIPAPGPMLRNVATELILGFFLMLVIIAVATDLRVSSTTPALAIGFTVVVCVLIGGPITGGSMNPARSFGPALFAGGAALSSVWLYFVAPPVGAVLAARLFEAVRLHPDNATGAPNELPEALREIREQ
jgi:MIP family channel proteins